MAESKGAQKGTEKAKNQAAAGRMSHLRAIKFETEGYVGAMPSVAVARKAHSSNLRLITSQSPITPRPSGTAVVASGAGSAAYRRLRP